MTSNGQINVSSSLFVPRVTVKQTAQSENLKEWWLSNQVENIRNYIDKKLSATRGECMIVLGMGENDENFGFTQKDLIRAKTTLQEVVSSLGAEFQVIATRTKNHAYKHDVTELNTTRTKIESFAEYVLVRQNTKLEELKLELRVAVCGNVDAGKSTLLGVLTRGMLDDSRGKARACLFRHKHEIETGRTSSVSSEIIAFDSKGTQIQNDPHRKKPLNNACKVVSLVDLAGHEKYLKTTIFGLCGSSPDFAMLIVGSNMGIVGMTKEHLGILLALNVPVMVVVTKIDMCPESVLQATLQNLTKILKSPGCRKVPVFVSCFEDVARLSQSFERLCPVFLVSNVTGTGLDLLRCFINLLPVQVKFDCSKPAEYQILDSFTVPGVGTVVSGTLIAGTVNVGDSLELGPDSTGAFQEATVKGIHIQRVASASAAAGRTTTFALKKIKRAQIRKGMVMIARELNPISCREFQAEIMVLSHSTTITRKYQAMLHCQTVRQIVSIVDMDRDVLRTGDRAFVRFRFLVRPEFLREGTRILFREGRAKGVGKVVQVFPIHVESEPKKKRLKRIN